MPDLPGEPDRTVIDRAEALTCARARVMLGNVAEHRRIERERLAAFRAANPYRWDGKRWLRA